MANISDLPAELKDHARMVPEDTFRALHQGEAEHRLRHVDEMLRAAEPLQAEQYRHVTASARRHLKAMPNAQFMTERNRLRELISDADRAGHLEVAKAFRAALRKLEDENPQAPGVQEAMMAYDKAGLSPGAAKAARKAREAALIQKEVDKAYVRLQAEQDRLRAEIQQFKRDRGL
jgi:hypothetical protein